MGCDQTTMQDTNEAERERTNPTMRQDGRPNIPTSPSKSIGSPAMSMGQRKDLMEKKKDPHGVSVTDKKDLEYSAFKQNILNKQSPHAKKPGISEADKMLADLEQKNQLALQEQKNQEVKILARVRQEMFLLSLLEEKDDEEEREREIEEREIYYLNQKGWANIGLSSQMPKIFTVAASYRVEPLQDPDLFQWTNQSAASVMNSFDKMKVNDVGTFITHFEKT
jgi:hypothetical protein